MEAVEGWDVTFNFVVEGVLLLLVAVLGLVGNLASFVILLRQKVQQIFHNLLFLLSTFDTVSRILHLHNGIKGKCQQIFKISMFQIYLVSAITLFALPNISVHFAGCFRHLTMPFMLPVAHIGLVNE